MNFFAVALGAGLKVTGSLQMMKSEKHSSGTNALQRSAGAKGNGPVNGADVNALVYKSNVNRTRRMIEEEVP